MAGESLGRVVLGKQGSIRGRLQHNEIPALRELLDPLSIKGRVITADALHTQRETAHFLVEEKGAHYLFTVKDNQKTLANDLKAFDWESIPP